MFTRKNSNLNRRIARRSFVFRGFSRAHTLKQDQVTSSSCADSASSGAAAGVKTGLESKKAGFFRPPDFRRAKVSEHILLHQKVPSVSSSGGETLLT